MVTVTAYKGDQKIYHKNVVDKTIEKLFNALEKIIFSASKKELEFQRRQLEHLHEAEKPQVPVPKDDLEPCLTK